MSNAIKLVMKHFVWAYSALCALIVFVIAFQASEASNDAGTDTSIINQVPAVWATKPFVNLTISRSGFCDEAWEPVFSENWQGTTEGCDCSGINSYRVPYNRRNTLNTDSCSRNETIAGCRYVAPRQPMKMVTLNGGTICGLRGNLAYKDVTYQSTCSQVTCNPDATSQNKVCASSVAECPITDI